MNLQLCFALVLAGLLALAPACSRSNSGAAPGAQSVAVSEATLAELTQSVRKFAVEQRQAPQSLDELVAKGYLETNPVAPPGKTFIIDKNLQVHLANR